MPMQKRRHKDRWSRGELEIMVGRLAVWLYEHETGSEWHRENCSSVRASYLTRGHMGMETVLGIRIDLGEGDAAQGSACN